ncbi:hypothetical protein C0V72_15585, partial [Porphyrobacter sp. TH134]|uniref:hypothetical protein n=1 Tax=Porphyrobacter sp. TH134 TaxID=2067450 RepID=UPI000CB4008E
RAAGRTLQRNIESARPASSATLITYTTCRDATVLGLDFKSLFGYDFFLPGAPRTYGVKAKISF